MLDLAQLAVNGTCIHTTLSIKSHINCYSLFRARVYKDHPFANTPSLPTLFTRIHTPHTQCNVQNMAWSLYAML